MLPAAPVSDSNRAWRSRSSRSPIPDIIAFADEPAFTHGDLQVSHVFVKDDVLTGVLDWSEAGQGDPLYDVALLTLGHEQHLADVIAGYGTDVDLDVIHGYWSKRGLLSIWWLAAHGLDPFVPGAEVDVLRARNVRSGRCGPSVAPLPRETSRSDA